MDDLENLEFLSLVSKVTSEIQNHLGVSDKTLAEFVALAKSQPGKLNYGSSGASTQAHLLIEMWSERAGIKMQHIPYKGSSQAITDLMGGTVDVFMASVPTAI